MCGDKHEKNGSLMLNGFISAKLSNLEMSADKLYYGYGL